MKKNLIGVLVAALALVIPSLAQADAWHLDKDFGARGEVTTLLAPSPAPFPWGTTFHLGSREPRTWLARTPEGAIVVLVGNTLLEYRPGGHLNRSFGANGQVSIGVPPGTLLEPSGVTVDSRGRILVAGTARSVDRNVASVFVARYLEEGRPDQSFGEGGVVLTDLGLSAPTPPARPDLARPPAIEGPIVEASGLAVDALDRPLLTGIWVSGYQFCYPFTLFTVRSTGYLARLDENGNLDPGFAGDGVVADPTGEARLSPVVDGDAVLSVGTLVNCVRATPVQLELARIEENGDFDEGFGAAGRVALPQFYEVKTVTRDRFGRVFVLASGEQQEGLQLLRLRRNGSIDSRFGKGDVVLPLERPSLASVVWGGDWHPALASDGRGRPLFAGTAAGGLTLGRLRRDGAFDRRFGRQGLVFTRLPGEVRPEQILVVNGGKVLVGGTWFKGGEFGIFLTRYSGS